MATGERKRKRVYCSECAYLFLMKGVAPTCIALCKFVQGPLRRVIDIAGIVSAERRNRHNNCKFFKRFDLAVLKKRYWLKKKFRLEGLNFKKMIISHYALKDEKARKETFIHGKRKEDIENSSGHSELGYAGKRLEELKDELKEDDGRRVDEAEAGSAKEESFFDKLTDGEKRDVVTDGRAASDD